MDSKPQKKKLLNSPYKVGLFISIVFFVGFLAFFIVGSKDKDFYFNLAVFIIVSWLAILIIYYAWAIGFYNVNMGWTDGDWKRLFEAKKVNPEAGADEPTENPHKEETLGLPNGTVRGTIAISLLVGGLAMMIASLSFKDRLQPNEYFIDNFEFFKTAYLMMIAFYFGNKSLEFLKDRKQVVNVTPPQPGPTHASPTNAIHKASPQLADAAKGLLTQTPPNKQPATAEADVPAEIIQKEFTDPNSVG
jgi:magnesium-transporting ATPase (P-type)